jgi:hypothetical protein
VTESRLDKRRKYDFPEFAKELNCFFQRVGDFFGKMRLLSGVITIRVPG